jgi:hypothetical protein
MKETYYFPHDYNARGDRKIVKLTMQHGMEGIGLFWCLVEMLYEESGYLPLEYKRIAFELRVEVNVVQSIIHDFDLFTNDGSQFWSESVLERLTKRFEKSEKARESVQKRWGRVKKDTNVLPMYDDRNTIKEKKEKEIKENKGKIPFKIFWDAYDKKIDWKSCESIWGKLSQTEREACLTVIPAYKLSTPDKNFRLNPLKFLNQKSWENEIIISNGKNRSNNKREVKRVNDLWNQENKI